MCVSVVIILMWYFLVIVKRVDNHSWRLIFLLVVMLALVAFSFCTWEGSIYGMLSRK